MEKIIIRLINKNWSLGAALVCAQICACVCLSTFRAKTKKHAVLLRNIESAWNSYFKIKMS